MSGTARDDGWFFARGTFRLGWVAGWRLRQRTAAVVLGAQLRALRPLPFWSLDHD